MSTAWSRQLWQAAAAVVVEELANQTEQELEHQTILQLQGLFRWVFLRQVYNNEKPYSKYQDWAYIIYIIQFLPGAEPNKLPPAGFPKEGAGVGAKDANRQLI